MLKPAGPSYMVIQTSIANQLELRIELISCSFTKTITNQNSILVTVLLELDFWNSLERPRDKLADYK